MKLEDYHNIYFLGIGGIGMSALGRWFLKKGLNVSGYDRTSTTLTNELQKEGMAIHFEDSVDNIPASGAPTKREDPRDFYAGNSEKSFGV